MQHLHACLAAHVPPLVRAPVNSFEFHRCRRTPQVGRLTLSLSRGLYIAHGERPSFTVRTTRVSNPVRYPHLRASTSVTDWQAAFAIGVLRDIYAFHRYTTSSACRDRTQGLQFQLLHAVEPRDFTADLKARLRALPLNPINPDNACILRITAAAGTELADAYSCGTCKQAHVPDFIPA